MALDEEAKVIQEVAKFGTETITVGEKFGSYLARVFGSKAYAFASGKINIL